MGPRAAATDDEHLAEVLAAFVDLVSTWSLTAVQARIAQRSGVDIAESDVRTLHTLGKLGGAARPAALADELGLTRPTMSKSLSRLEAAGLVERSAAADDGRATDLTLTESGRAAYQRLVDAGIEMVRTALEEAPVADTQELIRFAHALRRSG
jgi:DNA-binding MarR family transcriptional regulator